MNLLYDGFMDKMKWIIFSVIVVAIFGGIIFLNKSNEPKFTGDAGKIITEGPIADRYTGTPDQRVVLIEYGDFQCPACARMYPTIEELRAKHGDKLTFIFRDRPLTTIHPNALAAATAAEAVGMQGQFFAMYNLLYQNQNTWSAASSSQRGTLFEGLAAQAGINIDQYRKDLENPAVSAKIDRDRATASKFGANSTPTFILNGEKVPEGDATNPEKLTQKIDDAIKQMYPEPTQ